MTDAVNDVQHELENLSARMTECLSYDPRAPEFDPADLESSFSRLLELVSTLGSSKIDTSESILLEDAQTDEELYSISRLAAKRATAHRASTLDAATRLHDAEKKKECD